MTPSPPLSADHVRHCLRAAGFPLVGAADEGVPGLRVVEVLGGALVRWTASDAFAALADHSRGTAWTGESMQAVVRAAVTGVLARDGLAVVDGAGGDLLVAAGSSPRPAAPAGDRGRGGRTAAVTAAAQSPR